MVELWEAARDGKDDKLRELLKSDSINYDIEIKNSDCHNFTPLLVASVFGHLSCVELLLEVGADRNCMSTNGSTPLMFASYHNFISVVSALIAAGADVDLPNICGWTPLMTSAYSGHSEITKLLLEVGADNELKDEDGKTALDLVIEFKRDKVVTIFKEHEQLELVVRPEVVLCSGHSLPNELSELCGDFVVFTPKRREIDAKSRKNVF